MDIVKSAKNIGSELEKGVEVVSDKIAQTYDNLASHLPFSNLAKKDSGNFHLEIDLPGVKKENIDLTVEDGLLSVSAIREYKNEVSKDDYYISESAFGKFERRYTLPENIDTESISANFHDGRLEIELQKNEKAKGRSISIK